VNEPRFPDLPGVQRLVWKLIGAPEGVARGALDLASAGAAPSADLAFLVRPGARMDPTEQLDVYADMYFYRLRDCLAEDFPCLAAWIGEARWHNLVTDYLLAHPSTHFSLRELGRAMPGYVAEHTLGHEFAEAGDLAALEWARVDVFDETDAAPLDRESLLAHAGSEQARFRLLPAARVLRLHGAVLPLWRRLSEPDADATARGGHRVDAAALVWRQGFAVFHRSLAEDEARCLEALAAGATALDQIGELLAEAAPPDFTQEQLVARLAELIGFWTRDELLCRK